MQLADLKKQVLDAISMQRMLVLNAFSEALEAVPEDDKNDVPPEAIVEQRVVPEHDHNKYCLPRPERAKKKQYLRIDLVNMAKEKGIKRATKMKRAELLESLGMT